MLRMIQFNKSKNLNILSIFILLFVTLFLMANATQSFWIDELDNTIGKIIDLNIVEICRKLLEEGYNLPLYPVILAPFYKFMPYGELWLLIPSISFTVIGIIVLSIVGTSIGNREIGFIALCVASISHILLYQCGLELRPYSVLFCFTAWVIRRYHSRRKDESYSNIVKYGISMLFLLYSHWFGALLIVFYFLTDIYLYMKKEIRFKCAFSYLLAGMFFLPWLIIMLLRHTTDLTQYWAAPPGLKYIYWLLRYLTGAGDICFYLFTVGCFVITVKSFKALLNKGSKEIYHWMHMILSGAFIVGVVYIYSRYINPSGSIFVYRYFIVLLPYVFLITAFAIYELIYLKFGIVKRRFFLTVGIISFVFCIAAVQNYKMCIDTVNLLRQPYRQAAEWLAADERIYMDDSIIIAHGKTWVNYYFDKRGHRIPQNAADFDRNRLFLLYVSGGQFVDLPPKPIERLLDYDTVYLFKVPGFEISQEFISFIEQNFIKTGENAHLLINVYSKP